MRRSKTIEQKDIQAVQCYWKSNKVRNSGILSWSLKPENKLTSLKQRRDC